MPDEIPPQPVHVAAAPMIETPGQVAVPKWAVSVVGTVFMTLLLASGGWVIRTWDAPERIATLESEVSSLKDTRAAEKLQAQEKLSKIHEDVALMQKDVESINGHLDFITARLTQ